MARYLFRSDASIEIGSGHVMRCITLANELRRQGHDVYFICRDLPGHLAAVLEQNMIAYSILPRAKHTKLDDSEPYFSHSKWLTVSQKTDFLQSKTIIINYQPNWIIVDHYGLSAVWQEYVRDCVRTNICVIDDLADRSHLADVLVDQNLGHIDFDYNNLVPKQCQLLIGPQYALLRPEFKYWRSTSLKRRENIKAIRRILINLGGVDKDDVTGEVLRSLATSNNLDINTEFTIVMGKTAPHLDKILAMVKYIPYFTRVLCGVNNMAELMTNADLAIGAAGSTSWERCCLGVPTIQIVIADNQTLVADALFYNNAAFLVKNTSSLSVELNEILFSINADNKIYMEMSKAAQAITDGDGCSRVSFFLGGNAFG